MAYSITAITVDFDSTYRGSIPCGPILSRGGAEVARLAHNQEVVGSIPTPAMQHGCSTV